MHIYLDESGDLGFSSKASKYFVIAALLTKDSLRIEKCITKVRKERLPTKYKKIPELKYHNSDNIVRRRILQCIAKTDMEIAYAVLRKRQVYENLRNKPNILYNFLCGSLIGNVFRKYHINKCIQAVDFVVGAIARNYEREDPLFYKIIDGRIKIALDFFKGKIK